MVTPGNPDTAVIVTGDPDRCGDIGDACVDLDEATGHYCGDEGAQADVVVVDGEVVEVICYPPAEDGSDIRETEVDEGGTTQVPQTESGTIVVFPEETDGQAIVDDMHIEAVRTTIFGNGPDNTIIDGNLSVASNNSRVRGVTITGDASYELNANNSAISFCRIEKSLTVISSGFAALNCQVFGDVNVSGSGATLTNIGVQGEWVVSPGTVCNGCYSFEDANADFLVQADELGDELLCD